METLYGRQVVRKCTNSAAGTFKRLKRFIGCGKIRAVGPSMVKQFVSIFGLKLINVLINHLDYLLRISSIGEKRAKQIYSNWIEHRTILSLVDIMQEMEISVVYGRLFYIRSMK